MLGRSKRWTPTRVFQGICKGSDYKRSPVDFQRVIDLPDAAYADDRSESWSQLMTSRRIDCIHTTDDLDIFETDPFNVGIVETAVSQHLRQFSYETLGHPRNQKLTCSRNATSCDVPYLSGFGKLISFRYNTRCSQSFGLYIRPVLLLTKMQAWFSFCKMCSGDV